ncbi:MAG: hypothetical protein AAGN35_19425 [Bacteroidota bacterium]
MRTRKAVYYLAHFSTKQKSAFRDFLASPYFNKKAEPARLFEVIERRVLRYKRGNITPEEAYAEVFPGTPFDKDVFRKLMNRLLNLVLEFLGYETLRRDRGALLRATHRTVSTLGADHYFEFLHRQVTDQLAPNDIDYFEYAYQVELSRSELLAKKSLRSDFHNFDRLLELAENSYIVKKLDLGYHSLTTGRLIGKQSESMDDFLAELGDSIELRPLVIQMLYRRYMTLTRLEDPTHFYHLRRMLTQHTTEISTALAGELYKGLLSYSIYRVNLGDQEFLPELLQVYQAMLRQGFLSSAEGLLPAAHFKNIVVVAARAGEMAWADWFIDQYGPQIEPELRETALVYNQAVLNYFRRQFKAAEQGLVQIAADPKDIFYGIDARSYLLRIYYETVNFDGMESLCHSFRFYLTRNKSLPAGRKKQYLTFLALYRRLMNVPPRDFERLSKLKADILASPRIAPRVWLLEKLDDLLNDLPQHHR